MRRLLTCAVAAALLAASAAAQQVTGYWDFDSGDLTASVGQDGQYWVLPETDQRNQIQFGSTSSFSIPALPGGSGGEGVMKFPAFDGFNGIEVYPGTPATFPWFYVNNYTIVMDVLYPAASASSWRSLWQTNRCNTNDGDFFINPSGGIGISGQYTGTTTGDTWHRLAFSVGLTGDPNAPTTMVDKYIDGVLVGTQSLGGADGRWALYPDSDGYPSFIFTDNDGDTAEGYCAAFQLRERKLDGTEIAALGGAAAGGIPQTGGDVAGQWDFENAADGFAATVGNDLVPFNAFVTRPWGEACRTAGCALDLAAATGFGTSADFGIAPMMDGPPNLMRAAATIPCTGYLFPHGADANGGGTRVNNYTVIADMYYDFDLDWNSEPVGHDPTWTPIIQTDPSNSQDAMLWVREDSASAGVIGDDGYYGGTSGFIQPDRWMRVVAVVEYDPNAPLSGRDPNNPTNTVFLTKYVIFGDDSLALTPSGEFGKTHATGAGDDFLDGKRALVTNEEADFDALFYQTNDWPSPVYTHSSFLAAFQVRDYSMTRDEVLELGGPRTTGIPLPGCTPCPEDINGNCSVELGDLALELAAFGTCTGDPQYNADADFDNNGCVDLTDLARLLALFGSPCPG